jgi:hypothetical protein
MVFLPLGRIYSQATDYRNLEGQSSECLSLKVCGKRNWGICTLLFRSSVQSGLTDPPKPPICGVHIYTTVGLPGSEQRGMNNIIKIAEGFLLPKNKTIDYSNKMTDTFELCGMKYWWWLWTQLRFRGMLRCCSSIQIYKWISCIYIVIAKYQISLQNIRISLTKVTD